MKLYIMVEITQKEINKYIEIYIKRLEKTWTKYDADFIKKQFKTQEPEHISKKNEDWTWSHTYIYSIEPTKK